MIIFFSNNITEAVNKTMKVFRQCSRTLSSTDGDDILNHIQKLVVNLQKYSIASKYSVN